MGNNPINGTDPDGAFWKPIVNADGSVSYVAEENDTVQSFVDQYGVTYDQAKGLLNGNEKIFKQELLLYLVETYMICSGLIY